MRPGAARSIDQLDCLPGQPWNVTRPGSGCQPPSAPSSPEDKKIAPQVLEQPSTARRRVSPARTGDFSQAGRPPNPSFLAVFARQRSPGRLTFYRPPAEAPLPQLDELVRALHSRQVRQAGRLGRGGLVRRGVRPAPLWSATPLDPRARSRLRPEKAASRGTAASAPCAARTPGDRLRLRA